MSDENEDACDADRASRRAGIIGRLYTALDRKMREIETRIEQAGRVEGEGMSVADSERDARTLTTLARLYEKICELEESKTEQAEEGAKKEIDADNFRNEIAERLERMLAAKPD